MTGGYGGFPAGKTLPTLLIPCKPPPRLRGVLVPFGLRGMKNRELSGNFDSYGLFPELSAPNYRVFSVGCERIP